MCASHITQFIIAAFFAKSFAGWFWGFLSGIDFFYIFHDPLDLCFVLGAQCNGKSPSKQGVINLADNFDSQAFEVVNVIFQLPNVGLLNGPGFFNLVDDTLVFIEKVDLDVVQLNLLAFSDIAVSMQNISHFHRLAGVLQLNVMGKEPQLAFAHKIVVDLNAGDAGWYARG